MARVVVAGIVGPLLLLPVLAVLLIGVFRPLPEVAMGLLLVAACPIGGISNLYSYLARASTELSVVLTGLSCLLAALTIPALALVYEILLGYELGLRVPLPLLFGQLVLLLLLPVATGMWIRQRWPAAAEAHRLALRGASLIGLGILLTLVIAEDTRAFVGGLSATVPVAASLVAGAFAAGWLAGMAAGASRRDRFTLAAEFATRNVAVAVAIAVTLLGRVEFATFATVYFLTEVPILLLFVALFRPGLSVATAAS